MRALNALARARGFSSSRKISSLTSMPKPSARFCSRKLGMSARATRWTLMSSFVVAAALADAADAVGANQREAFGQHPGRGVEFAEPLHAARR